MDFQTLVFFFLSAILVFASLRVITARNPVHAALNLILAFFTCGGIWALLQAEFLAIAIILVYVGAVMTLVIFVIMLTEHLGGRSIRQNNRQSPAALVSLAGIVILLTMLLLQTPWPVTGKALESKVSVMSLGKALMGTYAFPFEVISVILIACLIGAIAIAKKDIPEKDKS